MGRSGGCAGKGIGGVRVALPRHGGGVGGQLDPDFCHFALMVQSGLAGGKGAACSLPKPLPRVALPSQLGTGQKLGGGGTGKPAGERLRSLHLARAHKGTWMEPGRRLLPPD